MGWGVDSWLGRGVWDLVFSVERVTGCGWVGVVCGLLCESVLWGVFVVVWFWRGGILWLEGGILCCDSTPPRGRLGMVGGCTLASSSTLKLEGGDRQ